MIKDVYKISLHLILASLLLATAVPAFAQLGGPREMRSIQNRAADDLISMKSSLPFQDALRVFSDLSRKKLGKVIIDPEGHMDEIGIDIEQLHWLDALETVLKQNDLWYSEYEDYIMITKSGDSALSKETLTKRQLFETREVIISALFFEANHNNIQQLGSDWSFANGDSSVFIQTTPAISKPSLLDINIIGDADFGTFTSFFKILENKQIGEILASPRVTVRSGKEGEVQIGSDFTIATKDFAGNTVTQFFSTGSIIKVTPQIITMDTLTFINLDLDVQKSSAQQSELGLEVKKTASKTSILLLDNEETMIGGLFSSDETLVREGVPFLKDLPWWVFGLKYIFGHESKTFIRKELIILLKAELRPSLADRASARLRGEEDKAILRKTIDDFDAAREHYREQTGILEESKKKNKEEADQLKTTEE